MFEPGFFLCFGRYRLGHLLSPRPGRTCYYSLLIGTPVLAATAFHQINYIVQIVFFHIIPRTFCFTAAHLSAYDKQKPCLCTHVFQFSPGVSSRAAIRSHAFSSVCIQPLLSRPSQLHTAFSATASNLLVMM